MVLEMTKNRCGRVPVRVVCEVHVCWKHYLIVVQKPWSLILGTCKFYRPKHVWSEQKLQELESVKVELTIACLSFSLSLSQL